MTEAEERPGTPNLGLFSGLADVYDRYRPRPPAILVDILTQLAGVDRPGLVVDLGSGTGLSTALWLGRADEVVGVEPNADMRAMAEARLAEGSAGTMVRMLDGVSSGTGLPEASADIITISQALHWMEPESTFREAARVLRPGGIFAAYDCDFPATIRWEIEAAYNPLLDRVRRVAREMGLLDGVSRWDKGGHLDRMRESGRFRSVHELCVHNVEEGDADRLVGVVSSRSIVGTLLQRGVAEREMGLDLFRAEAQRVIGDEPIPWYWTYRVRIGVR